MISPPRKARDMPFHFDLRQIGRAHRSLQVREQRAAWNKSAVTFRFANRQMVMQQSGTQKFATRRANGKIAARLCKAWKRAGAVLIDSDAS
jgi:hypothetical protein